MALQSSGAISLNDINIEFSRGSGASLSLSQLYRGGGIVGSNNTNVPTSGAISLSNFYGATRRATATVTYSTSQSNINFTTSSVPGYVAGVTDITVNIPSGVSITSTSSTSPAFTVGAFASGDTIYIVNAGSIAGAGGKGGGEYGSVGNYFYKSDGVAGGNAIDLSPTSAAVTINNTGVISGGGGGGGNGQGAYMTFPSGYTTATHYIRAGGGGGGAGNTAGAGGNYVGGSTGYPVTYYRSASNGSSGTGEYGGSGGLGDYGHWSGVSPNYYWMGGAGGSGGARGASGGTGTRATYSGQDIGGPYNMPDPGPAAAWVGTGGVYTGYGQFTSGGAAGNAIKGTGKLSSPLTNTGTIYGPQVA